MELNLLYALVGCSEGKKTPINPYTAAFLFSFFNQKEGGGATSVDFPPWA
jgi:hypothetical protein